MTIYFLLPSAGHAISGGFKVVYEYASGLANLGYRVEVVHPANGDLHASLVKKLWRLFRWIQWGVAKSWKPEWFTAFGQSVKLTWRPNLRLRAIGPNDIVVYSSYLTAEWSRFHQRGTNPGFYLVHDYEHFMVGSEELKSRILNTFRLGLKLMVTSPAGVELVRKSGQEPDVEVPNGIDIGLFCLPGQGATRHRIGFPARPEFFKGTADAVKAMEPIQERFGDKYQFWAFGPYDKPLPDWVEWSPRLPNEDLIRLYQETLVFVTASHFEGWGLPGSEAMACGAALVSTEHGGVRAYARHEENALLSPIQDVTSLTQNVERLLVDEDLRQRLATEGRKTIITLSKEAAFQKFKMAIGL